MAETGKKHKDVILSLQALRACGAILIFLHHAGFRSAVVTAFGDCAVNWFMMLSGFVLAAGFGFPDARLRCASWRDLWRQTASFAGRRMRRIAPLYYVALALMILLMKFHVPVSAAVCQALMIQSWVPREDIFFGLNGPAWFISDILFCYAMFLPLMLLWTQWRRFARAALVVGVAAYFIALTLIPAGRELFWIYIFPPMQLPSFIIGMLLWPVADRLRKKALSPAAACCLTGVAVALAVACMFGHAHVPAALQLSAFWWPSTALLLVVLTTTDAVRCFTTRVLHTPLLVELGNASFSFFILHLPWIWLTHKIMRVAGVELPLGVEVPVSIMLLAALTLWIHKRFYPKRI